MKSFLFKQFQSHILSIEVCFEGEFAEINIVSKWRRRNKSNCSRENSDYNFENQTNTWAFTFLLCSFEQESKL